MTGDISDFSCRIGVELMKALFPIIRHIHRRARPLLVSVRARMSARTRTGRRPPRHGPRCSTYPFLLLK